MRMASSCCRITGAAEQIEGARINPFNLDGFPEVMGHRSQEPAR
jgi:hypothetical protein